MPSDPRGSRRWLTDIDYHISKAETFVAGLTRDEFLRDDLRFYAVTRCLEIISEASRRLPEALKSRNSSIRWAAIASAGNVYRHEYERVAEDQVWFTLTQSLPALRKIVLSELAALDSDPS